MLFKVRYVVFNITFKQLLRILEIGLDVGAGARQSFEGRVQNRNNPLLFFKGWEGDFD